MYEFGLCTYTWARTYSHFSPIHGICISSSWVVTRTLHITKQKKSFRFLLYAPRSTRWPGACACVRIKFYKWHCKRVKNLRGGKSFDCDGRDFSGYLDFVLSIPSHLAFAGKGFWNSISLRMFEGMMALMAINQSWTEHELTWVGVKGLLWDLRRNIDEDFLN